MRRAPFTRGRFSAAPSFRWDEGFTQKEEPVSLKRFWTLPWRATVIRCRRAINPPEAHQRRTATRLGGRYLEIDAGHYPMLSHPDLLAPLLLGG
jgi:hypothetical protein